MRTCLIASSILALPAMCLAEQTIDFNRDVRPILSDRCFQCHGPNEHDRQAQLRLDRADGPEGAYRTIDDSQAIKPGSLADSAIWYRLTAENYDAMPPPHSSKRPLSADQKQIIKQWIEEGAVYSDFWAFVPPRKPVVPRSGIVPPWVRDCFRRDRPSCPHLENDREPGITSRKARSPYSVFRRGRLHVSARLLLP